MDGFDFTSSEPLFDFGGGNGGSGTANPGAGTGAFATGNEALAHTYSTLGSTAATAAPSQQHQAQSHQQRPHQHSHATNWPSLALDDGDKFDDAMIRPTVQPAPYLASMPRQSTSQPPSMQQQQQQQQPTQQTTSQPASRPGSNHSQQPFTLPPSGLDLEYSNLLAGTWQYQLHQVAQQSQQAEQHHQQQPQPHPCFAHSALNIRTFNNAAFSAQLQSSPVDFIPTTAAGDFAVGTGIDPNPFMTMAGPMDSINAMSFPLNDYPREPSTFPLALNTAALDQHLLNQQTAESAHSSVTGSSPAGTSLEVQSVADNEWSMVNVNPSRNSYDSYGTVSNPAQSLHIRSNSDSSSADPNSARLSGGYEEVALWPATSPHDFHGSDYYDDAQYIQEQTQNLASATKHHNSPSSSHAVSPVADVTPSYQSTGSSSTSPTSSGPTSPALRRRKSPVTGKTTKPVIKKTPAHTMRKDVIAEKKVGRRTGPLRPEQRQQAREIRKLRACLRCKFLKKTCDKGAPCSGCQPCHARLWQVPCTRMDIKDIAYFMKDWKADYERHVSLGFSVGNIKGFSAVERTLYITHGYGHFLPINAREVFVRDDKCFDMSWVESIHVTPRAFEVPTAKLSAGIEGVSTTLLSEYLDLHLDNTFESFVDDYFEGTFFITEILKTAHRYYVKEKTPSIRKALKLVLAYNLTQHVTMVEGLSDEEHASVRIKVGSRFAGMAIAPVMINFQVKCALADMWRQLQKDILEELSLLYSSVYSGDKLKNWPTIFMLAAILLAIWEEMQFDCHYRVPDEAAVNKFCDDMETTPVGVIVGLFQAVSTKLPGLQEWDTRKHHHLLGSNPAVCDALTEVKGHVNKYETYLRERTTAKFDRDDFECLSNKFLSKLVIRAN